MAELPPSYATQPPKRIAGALCLDFVNTVTWRGDPEAPGERLHDYGELLTWSVHAAGLDRATARALRDEARRRPQAAQAVLERALELREALARLVLGKPGKAARPAPAARAKPEPKSGRGQRTADLAVVNRALDAAPARTALVPSAHGFAWEAAGGGESLARPLDVVAWSAADLLASDQLGLVRRCDDERCGWMFVDGSRGGRRRWCSMEGCGNRSKVRRHYQRTREDGPEQA